MSTPSGFSFPAFRSAEWINDLIDNHVCFPSVLQTVDLTPDYMTSSGSASLYKTKSSAAREQIRRALFRHSLFKIQNAEVTYASCSDPRTLLDVTLTKNQDSGGSISGRLFDLVCKETSTSFIAEELWAVDRCGSRREYLVRYYREGKDGFSTRVIPNSLLDKFALVRYYFS